MIEVFGNFDWNGNNVFVIKDVNLFNFDIVDYWFVMNMVIFMDEFKQVFKDYDGVIFNNIMVVFDDG